MATGYATQSPRWRRETGTPQLHQLDGFIQARRPEPEWAGQGPQSAERLGLLRGEATALHAPPRSIGTLSRKALGWEVGRLSS